MRVAFPSLAASLALAALVVGGQPAAQPTPESRPASGAPATAAPTSAPPASGSSTPGSSTTGAPASGAPGAGGGARTGIAVVTEPVRVGPQPIEIAANGIVTAEAIVTVRTRVDGQIERVHVTEGQMVARGQPLFTLDSRSTQALLAQQEAQLARDRAVLTRTQADAQRYLSLRGEGFAAQQRYEQAQAEAAAAAANARATESLIVQTRLQIEFATITAETEGRLGALPQRVGNFVRQAENTTLATITQMDPVMVTFAVPERWLPEIQAAMRGGQPPAVRVRIADEGAPIEGPLVFVDSSVDTQTGTILLKARFANREGRLWPGLFVGVVLTPRVEQNVTTVPTAAVQTGQNGRFVFVLADGAARRRAVDVLRTAGDRTVVRGQLAANDRVIVEGAQRVTDGAAAQERNRPPAPGPQRVSSVN